MYKSLSIISGLGKDLNNMHKATLTIYISVSLRVLINVKEHHMALPFIIIQLSPMPPNLDLLLVASSMLKLREPNISRDHPTAILVVDKPHPSRHHNW